MQVIEHERKTFPSVDRSPQVEIIHHLGDLQALAVEWNALSQRFCTPLLSHEWFMACAEAFCPPDQLSIVVIRAHGRMIAAAPLVITRRQNIERLELLGTSFLCEPSGFLYTDTTSLRTLIKVVLGMRKPLLFRRLWSASPEATLLREVCRAYPVFVVTHPSGSPWIPITTEWDAFEAALAPSRRSCFRRARRRAEAYGQVLVELCFPSLNRLDQYLEEVFRVEATGWKGRHGSAILLNPQLQRFFNLYAWAAARSGILRIGVLRIAGNVVAAQLAVEYANRFWVLKIGYDEGWARCSPGLLLMHETIRSAFERGLEAYEFLGSDEPWIHIWTDHVRRDITHRVYPLSGKGLLYVCLDGLRSLINRMRR